MTKINEHQISNCEYGEQIAAYLYDEIAIADKNNFESHLSGCEICADEIAEFSVLRSSILDWRTKDFEPLETPVFVLPANREIKAESASWFAALKNFFALSPARAAVFAAVAVLFFSVAFFWFVTNHTSAPEMAKVENQVIEPKPEKLEPENIEENNQISPPEAQSTPRISDKNSVAPNQVKEPVTSKNSAAPSKVNSSAPVKTQTIQTVTPNQNPRVKTPVKNNAPALENDGDDDEDNSLRLSDMFDEVGMNPPIEKNSEKNTNDE